MLSLSFSISFFAFLPCLLGMVYFILVSKFRYIDHPCVISELSKSIDLSILFDHYTHLHPLCRFGSASNDDIIIIIFCFFSLFLLSSILIPYKFTHLFDHKVSSSFFSSFSLSLHLLLFSVSVCFR